VCPGQVGNVDIITHASAVRSGVILPKYLKILGPCLDRPDQSRNQVSFGTMCLIRTGGIEIPKNGCLKLPPEEVFQSEFVSP